MCLVAGGLLIVSLVQGSTTKATLQTFKNNPLKVVNAIIVPVLLVALGVVLLIMSRRGEEMAGTAELEPDTGSQPKPATLRVIGIGGIIAGVILLASSFMTSQGAKGNTDNSAANWKKCSEGFWKEHYQQNQANDKQKTEANRKRMEDDDVKRKEFMSKCPKSHEADHGSEKPDDNTLICRILSAYDTFKNSKYVPIADTEHCFVEKEGAHKIQLLNQDPFCHFNRLANCTIKRYNEIFLNDAPGSPVVYYKEDQKCTNPPFVLCVKKDEKNLLNGDEKLPDKKSLKALSLSLDYLQELAEDENIDPGLAEILEFVESLNVPEAPTSS